MEKVVARIQIDRELWKKVKAQAALEGKTIGDWLEENLRVVLSSKTGR